MKLKIKPSRIILIVFVLFLCAVTSWATLIQTGVLADLLATITPRDSVEISIIYAPELDTFMPQAIEDFNSMYVRGINPVTKERLAVNDKRIAITGKPGSSGTVMQQIVNAYQGVGGSDVAQPVIFAPSVRHWLQLANFQAGADIFDATNAKATANAPVVMAIWESRLQAIRDKEGKSDIGWQELLKVFNSPNGWNDYGFDGRQAVYYGHTDPFISSTALSTLIQEFTASARYTAGNANLDVITLDLVNNQQVQQGVRDIEELIKHYSARTTEFKEYIAQGPSYLDFVALEENDLIFINQGKTEYQPPEKLVALYPKEGTFMHEHPFGIVNADWVSEEQKRAAEIFTDYVLTEDVQMKAMDNGFRPANPDVEVGYPFVADLGVDANEPQQILQTPEPNVISAIQQSWTFVKKRAELNILLDSSGSMAGDKIDSAQDAIKAFVQELPVETSAGLVGFGSEVTEYVDAESLETNAPRLSSGVEEVIANGTTALYDAVSATVKKLQNDNSGVIKAVVLLSDGEDTSSQMSLNDLVNELTVAQNSDNPIFVIPIAYGADADINALNAIARASSTRVISGDTEDVDKILEIVSSYF